MLKKSLTSLFGGGALLLSSLAFAQGAVTPSTGAEYRTVITLTNTAASEELQLNLRAVTLPPARIASPFVGFDFNTALTITGDPELNPSLAQWTLVAGELPAGLTLSPSGQLTGTPTETATANITLEVTYKGKTATGSYTVRASGGDVRIEQYPDARYYEDGTWPKDCQGYIEPAAGYLYEGATGDGIYRIQPGAEAFDVNCNMTYKGGGWTVFQRNTGAGDFNRTWAEYEAGFGALTEDHWIGLERIHDLMKEPRAFEYYVANIGQGETAAAAVTVLGADGQYALSENWPRGLSPFSTFDRDNDSNVEENCAQVSGAGFWYPLIVSSCHPDAIMHLNANYYPDNGFEIALMTKKLPEPPPPPPQIIISSIPRIDVTVGNYVEIDLKPYISFSHGDIVWEEMDMSFTKLAPGLNFDNGIIRGIPTDSISCCSNKLTVNYQELTETKSVPIYYTYRTTLPPAFDGSYYEYDLKEGLTWDGEIDYSQMTFELIKGTSLYGVNQPPGDIQLSQEGVLHGAAVRGGYVSPDQFGVKFTYNGQETIKYYSLTTKPIQTIERIVRGTPHLQNLSDNPIFDSYQVKAKDIQWELVEGDLPPGITFENNVISGRFTDDSRMGASGNTGGYSPNYRNFRYDKLTFQAEVSGRQEERRVAIYYFESFGLPYAIDGQEYYFDLNSKLEHFFFEYPELDLENADVMWSCSSVHGITCNEQGIITGTAINLNKPTAVWLKVWVSVLAEDGSIKLTQEKTLYMEIHYCGYMGVVEC